MPFADEMASPLAVVEHRDEWAREFEELAGRLWVALGGAALAIDHVGSTSVPGLAAKDCIDVQVRVERLDERVSALMAEIGFRERPEPWNRIEVSGGVECRKVVFAPPVGARRCNVHVREDGGANARYALLFRDYLRADEVAREAWGAFKQRLAVSVPDLFDYGQIKASVMPVLMGSAERWAAATGWVGGRHD
ncbi:GrpB family protein [Actinomadura barringtoniae]|uniref:GrpB family protein n=1 Tax=Actinomadura barringtoniae TaxID=1427535 RepID=A0A939P6R6_9ACTN|nr:GrpB family protein [Actinomadura barringtoniae]MBO2446443.1 GrpB family protein [Actinomadura barringtoniae]